MIYRQGQSAITNSQLLQFLLSPQGMIFLILSMVVILLGFLVEIGGYITLSASYLHQEEEGSYLELLKINIKKLPQVFGLGGVILIAYFVLLIPLTGSGIGLSL